MINFFKSKKRGNKTKRDEKNPVSNLEIKENPNSDGVSTLFKSKKDTKSPKKECQKNPASISLIDIPEEKEIDIKIPAADVKVAKTDTSDTQKVDTGTEDGLFKPLKSIYKPLVKKRLTILLIENNIDTSINQKIVKLIKSNLFSDDLLTIINYGDSVKVSRIDKLSEFSDNDFLSYEQTDNLCLFDALIELEKCVSENYMEIIENENERVKITDIDIIGIGTCKDLNSQVSKENAIDCFSKIFSKRNVTTKYYCFTDENFLRAAEIGFRSIGAIFRNY